MDATGNGRSASNGLMLSEPEILLLASKVINDEIIQHFEQQGHRLTGAWEDSLRADEIGDGVTGYAYKYGSIVDAGTTAARIPFSENSGAGTSKYIAGLMQFWKLRKPGISDKEALSLAFATAKVQKKEGMSTLGSRDYSATKQRQRFIEDALDATEGKTKEIVFGGLVELIDETVNEKETITY